MLLEEFPDLTVDLNNAVFSVTKHRRYALWRTWDPSYPKLLFIGINPSTADGEKNDPTINRLTTIPKGWGYGGLMIANLSSKISSNPKEVREVRDSFLIEDDYIKWMKGQCEDTVVMWGNEGKRFMNRINQIKAIIPEPYCFYQNANGHPRHPLYMANEDLHITPFDWSRL